MPFHKGQSGNSGGRPKQTQVQKDQREKFRALLKQATVPALQSIIEIAQDEHSKDRLNACKYIIDKSYGADKAFLSENDDEPITIRVVRCGAENENEKDDLDDWG